MWRYVCVYMCTWMRVCMWHSMRAPVCLHTGMSADLQCSVGARVCMAMHVRTWHVCVHTAQPMGIPTAVCERPAHVHAQHSLCPHLCTACGCPCVLIACARVALCVPACTHGDVCLCMACECMCVAFCMHGVGWASLHTCSVCGCPCVPQAACEVLCVPQGACVSPCVPWGVCESL